MENVQKKDAFFFDGFPNCWGLSILIGLLGVGLFEKELFDKGGGLSSSLVDTAVTVAAVRTVSILDDVIDDLVTESLSLLIIADCSLVILEGNCS